MFKKSLLFLALLAPAFLFGAYTDVLLDFNKIATLSNDSDSEIKGFANIYDWSVQLNSSADFMLNRKLSKALPVPCEFSIVKDNKSIDGVASGSVLGIRANFPKSDYSAFVTISPYMPAKIYSGSNNGTNFYGRGVLGNVGLIKSISAWVKGKMYPHAFYINLRDQDGVVTPYLMDYMNFNGWKEVSYRNPNYMEDIRNRRLTIGPGYPRVAPAIAFESFTFVKDGGLGPNGDFIAYVAWVKVEYDKSVIYEKDDINDEQNWNIIKDGEAEKRSLESKRLRRYTELIDLERQKMNLPPIYEPEKDNRNTAPAP